MRILPLAILAALSLPAAASVTATDAWVRGTVPAQKSTGAFVTLTSTEDARVVSVTTPAARSAQIHESLMDGGRASMRHVESLKLPAGRSVELRPGGYHVMLEDLARPLAEGDRVPLTFTIEDKGGKRSRVEVDAAVRPLGR
ncbi:MAG TPA: copper chaperone PCu(A)C [Usitatibacter sp.]|nr:copper chaperone PCu(A)C [Usitatibacter sp.]